MRKALDLAGERFGRLTVIRRLECRNSNNQIMWECICDCGNMAIVTTTNLRRGCTKSCGCLKSETSIKNGSRNNSISDKTGSRYGRLLVIKKTDRKTRDGKYLWECLCDCGNTTYVTSGSLNRGTTKSCGCLKKEMLGKNAIEMTGKKYGRLTVIGRSEKRGRDGQIYWECKCECGNTHFARGENLRSGHTKSCGCLGGVVKTHGMSGSRIWNIWSGMMRRCYTPSNNSYERYGKIGIEICKEWHDFAEFEKWSKENGYDEKLTIDRIDPNDNYSPENCRWITINEQQKTENKATKVRLLMKKPEIENLEAIAKSKNITLEKLVTELVRESLGCETKVM